MGSLQSWLTKKPCCPGRVEDGSTEGQFLPYKLKNSIHANDLNQENCVTHHPRCLAFC